MSAEENKEHSFTGIHILGEMYGIEPSLLDNIDYLGKALCEGIEASGASLCDMQSKQFEPQGVTMLALLSESHASIHTYPDEGALFFDAFTCGRTCQPTRIADALAKALKPSHKVMKEIERGKPVSSETSTEAPGKNS